MKMVNLYGENLRKRLIRKSDSREGYLEPTYYNNIDINFILPEALRMKQGNLFIGTSGYSYLLTYS
jgi:hypothetical protein